MAGLKYHLDKMYHRGQNTSYLVGREVVQQLPDVVTVLALPVVACPGYTVVPAPGTLCNQTLIHSLQDFCRLGTG